MGKVTGFLEIASKRPQYRPIEERVRHYREFTEPLPTEEIALQGARCMDCGIPFCHQGCPVNNIIPDWNDLVYRDRWREAAQVLHSTNNFPEFTGRICPAPCETSCTLNINDDPVTIKSIECAIIDRAWEEGWVRPLVAEKRTGRTVAVVGSGPAGMACAQQLARVGHDVTVFERHATVGGLLRYGIPDFKMEKRHIDRRVEQMEAEGVVFTTGCEIGVDLPASRLVEEFDAVVLTGGAERPRDLEVPGRRLGGVHFAMDFLTQQNRRVANEPVEGEDILATDKHVVVIGGGDTGSDCIGTSWRQGAKSVTQLEIMPRPPQKEDKDLARVAAEAQNLFVTGGASATGASRPSGSPGKTVTSGPFTGCASPPRCSGSRAPSSSSKPTWSCSRWGSCIRCRRGCSSSSGSRSTSEATWPRTPRRTGRAWTRSSPRATCGGASRWWCGRSGRGGSARGRWTRI